VILQLPGVSYDSAVSNPDYHVRNEYPNVQYRINGILLPEGVSSLGPVLETGFIGNLNLLSRTLPAQYGLRTAGVVDLTTRSEFEPGGTLSLYGGSFGTISPRFDYGGSSGNTLNLYDGVSISDFQIPNVTGQAPLRDFGGTWFNSANLNENEYDSYIFNILALQTKGENYDTQVSFFSRYANVHFVPDIYGDLVFNNVASNVTRESLLNGIQFDGA
jgi:hypothetical protein